MWWVYALQNNLTGKSYIGCTSNVGQRLKEHNRKKKGTWPGRQQGKWCLKHEEPFEQKKEALVREKEIKRKKSRKYIEKLVNEDNSGVVD
ncbi:MAG: GIY-YIG nuclease family protein [Candidatus Omnitrophota bacterium]